MNTEKTHDMKYAILFFTLTFFSLTMGHAQEFEAGSNVINAGIGLGGYYGDYSTSTESPVLSLSYERGIWEMPGPGILSLGGYYGRKSFKYESVYGDYSWSYNVLGVRALYHYTGLDVEHLDVYGGAMVSVRFGSGDDYYDLDSLPQGSAIVGGRWYFTESFAGFVELGYGVAYATLGASFRF